MKGRQAVGNKSGIVVAAVEAPGGVRLVEGVWRISGTELGRRLEYCVGKPTMFNQRIVEKLLKAKILNNSDMVTERLPCKRGFGTRDVTEYWLTLSVARSIALEHVWTPQGIKLRKQVVEQLESLMAEKTEALQAPTVDYAAMAVALQQQTQLLQKHMGALSQPKLPPSVYIDEERAHLLKRMAQDTIAARGEGSVESIWQALRRKEGFIRARKGKRPRVFETVTVDKFDAVLTGLRADLDKAVNTPSNVSSLLRRTSIAAGNSVDVHYVCERINRLLEKVEVPLYALPRLYALAGVTVYPRPNGKNPDLRIDEAEIRKLVAWCTDHLHELKVVLESEKELHDLKASGGRRRKASAVE